MKSDLTKLQKALGVEVDSDLLLQALTHRSYANELNSLNAKAKDAGKDITNYERLEFLGDSVLGLVITEEIFQRFPNDPEGQLSPLRSGVVNTKALAQIARSLNLGENLRIGKGEETTGGRDKNSLLADACEALFGAIYLQHGFDVARRVILNLFDELIKEAVELGSGLDGKTALQDLTAARNWTPPEYATTDTGPDHDKEFTATVKVNGEVLATGTGKSKREAEQMAARTAYQAIKNREKA